jgi:putative NADH-flavin reductase
MSKTQDCKIAAVGGICTIGSHTLSALLATNLHTLTAISRSDSSATFPSNAAIKKGDYIPHSFIVSALTGNHVLIMQLGIFSNDKQVPLIRAAAETGVKYVLPTKFGSDPTRRLRKASLCSLGRCSIGDW